MAINTIKTLSLTLGTKNVECQLTKAVLQDVPTTEELTTFCGTESSSIPKYELALGGFQDYGDVDSVTDIIHTAYITDAEIAFVLTVGTKTRTGSAKAITDVPFGGDAGAALTFEVTLGVVGAITDGPETPLAASAKSSK